MDVIYPRGVDSARVIQVIETKSARIVTEYWSMSGKKLAENDPMLETQADEQQVF